MRSLVHIVAFGCACIVEQAAFACSETAAGSVSITLRGTTEQTAGTLRALTNDVDGAFLVVSTDVDAPEASFTPARFDEDCFIIDTPESAVTVRFGATFYGVEERTIDAREQSHLDIELSRDGRLLHPTQTPVGGEAVEISTLLAKSELVPRPLAKGYWNAAATGFNIRNGALVRLALSDLATVECNVNCVRSNPQMVSSQKWTLLREIASEAEVASEFARLCALTRLDRDDAKNDGIVAFLSNLSPETALPFPSQASLWLQFEQRKITADTGTFPLTVSEISRVRASMADCEPRAAVRPGHAEIEFSVLNIDACKDGPRGPRGCEFDVSMLVDGATFGNIITQSAALGATVSLPGLSSEVPVAASNSIMLSARAIERDMTESEKLTCLPVRDSRPIPGPLTSGTIRCVQQWNAIEIHYQVVWGDEALVVGDAAAPPGR